MHVRVSLSINRIHSSSLIIRPGHELCFVSEQMGENG